MEISSVMFVLLTVFCWGFGAFFDKASLRHMDPAGAFYMRSLFMIAVLAPLAAWKWAAIRQSLAGAHRLGPLFVLGSVVVSMCGVFFYLKALSAGEASKIVPLGSAYPFVTFALALMFLGESFTLNKLIGTLLLSAGIFFISK